MSNMMVPTQRAGQQEVSPSSATAHTLIVLVEDRPAAVDRVFGLFRRRRANMRAFTLAPGDTANVVRITAIVDDSQVAAEQLVEQIRKVVDVREVISLPSQQTLAHELALIKVSNAGSSAIIELGQLFGAQVVDITPETITLEVVGSVEKIEKLVSHLQPYSIHEVARSGQVAMARGTGN